MTSRMFQTLHLFVLSCLFLTVTSQTGKILPPQNVTLQWIGAFQPHLSWSPPRHQGRNCTYEVSVDNREVKNYRKSFLDTCSWERSSIIMSGGFLNFSVIAVCNGIYSKPAVHVFSDPELVKNFECYVYTRRNTHCGWVPDSHTSDLRFYYRLENHYAGGNSELQECSLYNYTGGVRTGCEVKATDNHNIFVFFNGTLNNRLVRNTFERKLALNVRPPALQWTVTKTEDKFNISWTPPDVSPLNEWTFLLNYTECNVQKPDKRTNNTSCELDRNPDCRYCIAIKAKRAGGGETPWSPYECFGKDIDALVYMAFIIPLGVTALAVLTFICCRKNIKKICPKIIKPADYISDIINNNNKGTVWNFPIPVEEEHTCEITVMDPQVYTPDC
ncbi:uncharacterized protein LOC103361154 [Stegastes partitus]|uniref:Uncharacterized LOC103361154 n=1 Tax=Stegastes partitus TaxID=144197 RepID=A0A3B4ZPU8_9TELE|nr:PREDICTED: uncharacterized protein LOC103361154 [Stegastes partitus]